MPISWIWPGNVEEVLDYRVWQFLADHPRRKVKMIIVEHYVRKFRIIARLFHYCLREGPIYWDVTRMPGIVDTFIYVGSIWRAPHIMLEEPQQRVTKNIVELVVHPPGGDYVLHIKALPGNG